MCEGCRAVQVATASQTTDGASVFCTMEYRVTTGPGHQSPSRFKSLGMTPTYIGQRIALIVLSAGASMCWWSDARPYQTSVRHTNG